MYVYMYVCITAGVGDHSKVHSFEEANIRVRCPGSISESTQGSEISSWPRTKID